MHVALLAGSVLQLARTVTPAVDGCRGGLGSALGAALADLATATEHADSDPAAATAHLAAARHHASGLQSAAREQRDIVLANVVASCVDDLQRVIELRQF